MRQFFTEQLSADTGKAPLPQRWRPQDLQDIKQLQEVLQQHAMCVNEGTDAAQQAIPMAVATAQLVADAARQVARQQVVEKNSRAYGVLLDEGYRAGGERVSLVAHGLGGMCALRLCTSGQQLPRPLGMPPSCFRFCGERVSSFAHGLGGM